MHYKSIHFGDLSCELGGRQWSNFVASRSEVIIRSKIIRMIKVTTIFNDVSRVSEAQ